MNYCIVYRRKNYIIRIYSAIPLYSYWKKSAGSYSKVLAEHMMLFPCVLEVDLIFEEWLIYQLKSIEEH